MRDEQMGRSVTDPRQGRRQWRRWLLAGSIVTFLGVLALTFVRQPVVCTRTATHNAGGVASMSESCRPDFLVLALAGAFLVGWLAALMWALRRRRDGTEPPSTEVPVFPQGF